MIAQLYLRRWSLELCFRDLKTTMGMEVLRCLTPDMVHKELLAFLIAHNFTRCLMAQSSRPHKNPYFTHQFQGNGRCRTQLFSGDTHIPFCQTG
jgi:hypothetical protein